MVGPVQTSWLSAALSSQVQGEESARLSGNNSHHRPSGQQDPVKSQLLNNVALNWHNKQISIILYSCGLVLIFQIYIVLTKLAL